MSAPVLSVLDIRLGRLRRALHEGDGGFSPGFSRLCLIYFSSLFN
ncbi:unnamed protein product [Brassica oleracea]|uniref:Uncharacterized protein n=1 Tax=Brassica oleracea TaxID=3712 RepID=A0A3P6FFF3_BRAOL|nr:unnamed protein product [Brassica oleracea]